MLKIILKEFAKYLFALVDIVKKDRISSSKYKNISKNRNNIVEISAKLKNRNLFNSRSRHLSKYKNF